jgi:hypothetical protein
MINVGDDVERVEISRGLAVSFEDPGRSGSLERGEAERVFSIVPERELDQTIAESADTVVEQNGMG